MSPSPPPVAPAAKPKLTLAAFQAAFNPDGPKPAPKSEPAVVVAPPSISAAPIIYTKEEQEAKEVKKPPINTAALMFKPRDKRNDVPTKTAAAPVPHESRLAQPKRTFEDWLAMGKDDGDAYGFSAQQQRERAGRKNKKQKKNLHIEMEARSDWSAGFVLSSTNIRGKRGEKFKTTAEFDERRSAWRTALGRPAQSRRPIDQDSSTHPPGFQGFAPPQFYDEDEKNKAHFSSAPSRTAVVPTDATGEDAYLRRMALSQGGHQSPPVPAPPIDPASPQQITSRPTSSRSERHSPSPPMTQLAPPAATSSSHVHQPQPGLGAQSPSTSHLDAAKPMQMQFQKASSSATISAAPVRYDVPNPAAFKPDLDPEIDTEMADAPAEDQRRSNRPGQKGFGERMMAKMGWKKGQGLGASGTGIITPLSVKVEKNSFKARNRGNDDREFRGPAGTGRIVGGAISAEAKAAIDAEMAKGPGKISPVVIIRGITCGRNLDEELSDGSFVQKLGDKCSKEFGNVERIHVDREQESTEDGAPVFIKFNAEMSALRAVQELNKETFDGNPMVVRYYDAAKFEQRVYQ